MFSESVALQTWVQLITRRNKVRSPFPDLPFFFSGIRVNCWHFQCLLYYHPLHFNSLWGMSLHMPSPGSSLHGPPTTDSLPSPVSFVHRDLKRQDQVPRVRVILCSSSSRSWSSESVGEPLESREWHQSIEFERTSVTEDRRGLCPEGQVTVLYYRHGPSVVVRSSTSFRLPCRCR